MAAKIRPVRLSSSFVLGQKTMGSHLQSVCQLQFFESDSLLGIFVPWRPFGDEVVTIFIKDTNVTNQWFTEGSSNKKTRRKKIEKERIKIFTTTTRTTKGCLFALKEMFCSPRCKNPQLTSEIQH